MDNLDNMTNEQILESVQETATDQSAASGGETETQPEPQMFEYQARGKTIQEPIETILKRASQGYDYAQSMADIKQKDADIAERLSRAEQLEQKWKPYDDYASQNPDWAERVNQSYQDRYATPQSTDIQGHGLPAEVSQKLNQMDQFMQTFEQQQKAQQQAEEDAKLSAEIDSVKSAYKDIDFGYTDPETGKSLELQVLEHANLNRINSFKAAFRDYYHDELVTRAQNSAKENAAKELQERNKSGFMGNVQASSKPTPSHKNMNYDQLIDAAINDNSIFGKE